MRKVILFFLILLLCNDANATRQVLEWQSRVPISVCQPSDSDSNCGGTGTSSGWTPSGTNVTLTTSSNNVGIGSATPGAKLDVSGTVRASNFSGSGTNITGTASGLTSGTVTTNANLTGPITSIGNATTISALSVQTSNINWSSITGNLNKEGINWTSYPPSGFMKFNGSSAPTADTTTYQVSGTYVTSVGATSPVTSSGGTTPTISTSMNTNKLIGRGTAGTGVMEEITLGTNLSLSGTTLNATSSGSSQWLTNGAVGIGTYSNVGVGTTTPQTTLTVLGNVGINTWTAANALDVNGTVSATTFSGAGTNLTGTAASLTAGTVTTNANLTGSDVTSVGNAATLSNTWKGWTASGTNVYSTTSSNNIGIGTTVPQGALVVTNGNIGIGTWVPKAIIQIGTSQQSKGISISSTGNIGIGTTTITSNALTVMNGNVGIGTTIAPQGLYVVGRIYATTGMNIGIGTASNTRLCVSNTQIVTCP